MRFAISFRHQSRCEIVLDKVPPGKTALAIYDNEPIVQIQKRFPTRTRKLNGKIAAHQIHTHALSIQPHGKLPFSFGIRTHMLEILERFLHITRANV